MSDQMEILKKSEEKISLAFQQADNIIMKKYMPEISTYPIKDLPDELANANINTLLRINRIERIVYDADENNLDKLMNVYNSVALCGGALVHIILCDGKTVEYYIGTRTNNINEIATCQSALLGSFKGNFPGSRLIQQDKNDLSYCLEKAFVSNQRDRSRVISVVSGIPGFRNEDRKEFVQGLEKLIDSMAGKEYALITIAEPVSEEQLGKIYDNYEEIYTLLSPFAKITQSYSESDSSALAESISDAVTESAGNTFSNTTSQSRTISSGNNSSKGHSMLFFSKNKGTTYGESDQSGSSYSDSQNSSRGTTQTKGTTDSFTTTTGQTLQLVRDNKRVCDLLQKIERQIKRIEDAKDTGLWNTATYCLSDDAQTCKTLAVTLQSLCRGKENTVESYSINTFTDMYKTKDMENYLRKMSHPVFVMPTGRNPIDVTPSSMISGSELVIAAGLPQKAINGLSISKMVSFARSVTIEDEQNIAGDYITIGSVYHMGKTENTKVNLNIESLSSHMLITGSTGSGKSNAVYQIINELRKKDVKFLIIEPVKGEYKSIFGNDSDVQVYGTNKAITKLLKINPFSFPNEIHVLEHIDRLIEIFNVCWPMYAAMPAILKDSILQAYQVCGWDLENSENSFGERVYPSFRDVQSQIRNILNSSDYSEDNKGDYMGALVTRINALTNGINGQMFTRDEIIPSELFDGNVIIDLSRIGSQETKSLIMGIMVMKLNEYRMACTNGQMNQELRHITVLEEAHNLLRNNQGRSSGLEGADMIGKSVEMITNSIAEMRTYGEGFIIVDQSPNAIDISAIRNTSTKIIMRLPEENDRQQAGRSAAMTDKQIPELARLPKGVAVIYQNNWLDPVLCKIDKVAVVGSPYVYNGSAGKQTNLASEVRLMLAKLLVGNRMDEILDISADFIRENIDCINLSGENKILILQAIDKLENGMNPSILEEESFESLSEVVCEIVQYDSFKNALISIDEVNGIQEQVHIHLLRILGSLSIELELALTQCIVRKVVKEDQKKVDLYARWRRYAVERRKKVSGCQ